MSNIFYNRLKKNIKKLSPWAKQANYQAFRLYDRDIPEYPYIVEQYYTYFIIFERGKRLSEDEQNLREEKIEIITQSLIELLDAKPENILWKQRKVQKGSNQYEKLSEDSKELVIQEGNAKVLVNLTDYLDTGVFLDHRPIRKKVGKLSNGKNILNLFSYTCTVSVHAALGGGSVTSVDLSNTYINWGKKNFEINNISFNEHQFIVSDCFKFIREDESCYDLIFIDPPSFSNSKKFKGVFDVQRDHHKLIELSMKRLDKKGILFFSNNFRKFKIDDFIKEKFHVTDITPSTIPIDFKDPKIHHCFEIRHKD